MSFIKFKALFMIFLISFISLSYYIPEAKAQQKVCCERTRDNAFCVYTDSSNCSPNHNQAPAFCEDTSFCTLGCCFDSNSGECFSNTAKSECDSLQAIWSNSASCSEVSQCSLGCCQLNNQGFLSTLTKCKQIASQYTDTEPNFDISIQDEFTCLNSVRSQEEGCCVTENTCSFITRSQCAQQETTLIGNTTKIGFYPGILCSNDQLSCDAAKLHHLSCFNEDVYWFDSEGNKENIFLGKSEQQKRLSYNNGKILEDPKCEAKPNDPNCGNCDYTKGTLCSEKDGEPKCIDLNCKDTTTFQYSPDSGSSKELGESWCIFDGPVGFGQDRPGSRHFRAACINGEEIIEPCADFREELCTQPISNGQPTNQFGSFYKALTQNIPQLIGSSQISNIFSGPGYSEAACRENRINSCTQCNEFSTLQEITECCNEKAFRDCYFLQSGLSNKGGTCIPNVPKGARFWSDTDVTSVLARQTTKTTEGQDETVIAEAPSVPADEVCSIANQECEVGFSRTTFSEWKCTYNCHCLTEDAFIAAHSVCRSVGDCGASANYIGEITRKGFDFKAFGPKGEKAIPPDFRQQIFNKVKSGLFDNALVKEPKEGGAPKKHGIKDFFKDSAIPLGLILSSGLLGFTSSAGFFGGLFYGPAAALGTLSGIISAGTGTSTIGGPGAAVFGPKAPITGAGKITKSGFDIFRTSLPQNAPLNGLKLNNAVVNIADKSIIGPGSAITGTSGALNLGPGNYIITTTQGSYPITVEAGKQLTYALGDKVPILLEQETITGITSASGKMTAQGAIEGAKFTGTGAQGVTSATTQLGTTNPLLVVWGAVQVVAWIWTIYNIIDLFGSDTTTGKVQFICKSWEPPSGGEKCEVCNEGQLSCSEYRCRSLGKGCKLINQGTENELCVSSIAHDTSAPRITADKEKMKNYVIQDEPNKGFTVTNPIPPFTAVSLAIKTDEPSQCKFSTQHSIKFPDMEFDFGSPILDFDHNITFSLPSELTENQALQLTNKGKYTLYVRCEDANGNSQDKDYIIQFQIEKGPDLEPPKIQTTSILSNTLIPNSIKSVAIDLFVNEPSQCKFSTRDIDYNLMENSFSCATSALDIETVNSGSYKCSTSLQTTLTATEPITNTFYFRCKDKSNNINQNSFRYSLISTPNLEINETSPSGILRSGSGITLQVKTKGGSENGKAICGVSQQDLPFTNIPQFLNTNANIHTQTLQLLQQGDYTFFVLCLDKAGNQAKTTIQFKVEADTIPPILLSVFKDTQLGIINIKTTEPTSCQYSDQPFEFGTGIPMTNDNSVSHEASLGNTVYIIKCQDEFKNTASFTIFP